MEKNLGMESEKLRMNQIDLLRFVFSVAIIYFHIMHSNIIPYTNGSLIYEKLAEDCDNARNIVACFFVLGGFFLQRSFSGGASDFFSYVSDRVVRLWPVLFLSILTETFFNGGWNNYETLILNSVFLQCIGVSLNYRGISWYVSAFFWVNIFYYAILKGADKMRSGVIVGLLTYFSFTFLINYGSGVIDGRETVFYFVNLGVLRALGGMGLGILIARAAEHLQVVCSDKTKSYLPLRVIGKVFEACLLLLMFLYYFGMIEIENHFVPVIFFSVFLLYSASASLEKERIKFIENLGKYSYSIYVMQQTGFLILARTLWQDAELVANVPVCIFLSIVFCVILGIAIYYLVEKPCITAYKKSKQVIHTNM